MKPKKKKIHHSRPHGGGVSFARQLAYEKAQQEALRASAADITLQFEADRQTQRAMWLMVCSIKDAYGFGPEKLQRFFRALEANTAQLDAWKAEDGEEYAYEKLRQIAERYTNSEIKYMYEEDPLGKFLLDQGRERNQRESHS